MSTRDFCVINFVREDDGVFVNGTISTLDGTPRASWTFAQDGGEFTRDLDVDEDDFLALWDAMNEPVFVRHAVRDPDAEMDFRNNYVIGIMFLVRGEAGRVHYLVPAGECDPVWRKWLDGIEALQRPS
ncbi:MAG TPA: hypothetical protein VF796_12175 [Humisphaera sp.]